MSEKFVSLCKSCMFRCKGVYYVEYCSGYRYKSTQERHYQLTIFDVLKDMDKMSSTNQ